MFDAVWKHLTEVLLADATKTCDLEQQTMEHESYRRIKITSYIPNAQMVEQVDEKLKTSNTDEGKNLAATLCSVLHDMLYNYLFNFRLLARVLVLTGDGGCGKTSILSYLSERRKPDNDSIILDHFVGCTSKSSGLFHTTMFGFKNIFHIFL